MKAFEGGELVGARNAHRGHTPDCIQAHTYFIAHFILFLALGNVYASHGKSVGNSELRLWEMFMLLICHLEIHVRDTIALYHTHTGSSGTIEHIKYIIP